MIFSEFARRVRDALGFAQGSPSSRRPGVDAAGKPLLQKADERYAILAQQQAEQAGGASTAPSNAGARAPRGLLALALATGVAAVLLVAGWWLWPRADGVLTSPAAEAASDPAQVAAVLPTFTPTPGIAGTPMQTVNGGNPQSVPMQIVIVTPTPGAVRALSIAGVLVDRPLAVAGGEQTVDVTAVEPAVASNPGAGAIPASKFDLASLVVPPMVEEVVNGPLAQVQVIPLPGLEPKITPVATLVAAPPTPTPLPELYIPFRAWSTFSPAAPEVNDHLWVGPAILADDGNQIAAPSYQFGSTGGGRYRPHHGIDVANPYGTPVRAGVSGEVVHAGMDDPDALGPYPNFYGNAVVIRLDQKLSVGGGGLDAFVLYGHLSQVTVEKGQRVAPGDVVGAVGMTGIAIGPHLHVEMRIGTNDYAHSVNPYLWLTPLPGNGAVAVRLMTADGRSWPGQRLTLARFENNQAVWGRLIETYLDNENIGPDPAWGENGAMGDVPAGYYVLIGNVNGEPVRAEFFVREGQTTFVELRTKQ